jgi:3-oxoadipate enol-lactonase
LADSGVESQVDVGGQKVRVLVEGKEGAPWIVMSHSIMADLHIWDAQMEALRGKFRIARMDIRGHGGSEVGSPPYDMQMLVQDVVKVFDHFGIDKAHFIGLSLGGMIGYGLALAHPERLLSVVISSSRADAPAAFRAPWDDRIALIRKDGMKALARPTVERWFSPEFLAAHPETGKRIASTIEKTPPQGFEGCARALQGLNYLGDIGRIKLPILMIAGARDATIPEDMRDIHGRIAQSRFEVIADSGHIPNVDNTAEFNRIVLQFLEQVAAKN